MIPYDKEDNGDESEDEHYNPDADDDDNTYAIEYHTDITGSNGDNEKIYKDRWLFQHLF